MTVVRLPSARERAFPWKHALGAVVIGLLGGLGLAALAMERPPREDAQLGIPVEIPEEIPETIPEVIPEEASAAIPTEPIDEPTTEIAGDDDEAPATEPLTPPPAERTIELAEGQVAYLRCDGVPQQRGPFPCPRDVALEEAVWTALRGVEGCAEAPGPGHADVVVSFEGASAASVRSRDTFRADVARTDADALLRCTREALEAARPTRAPRRLVISFRLELREVR